MHSVDALLMGRKTYETVLSFGTWPYEGKPVYVLSNRLISLDSALPDTVRLMTGSIVSIAGQLHGRGHRKVYLDGGRTIQSFLEAGMADELTITRLPVLLGAGRPLFGALPRDLDLEHVSTRAYPFGFVQSTYTIPSRA